MEFQFSISPRKREARHSHIGKNPGSLLGPYRGPNVPKYGEQTGGSQSLRSEKREARYSHIGRNPGSLLAVYVSTNTQSILF